jgi:hypothetical protein
VLWNIRWKQEILLEMNAPTYTLGKKLDSIKAHTCLAAINAVINDRI